MSRHFRYIRRGYRPTPDDEESDGFLPDRIRDGSTSLTREQRKFIENSEGLRHQEDDTGDSQESRGQESKASYPGQEDDDSGVSDDGEYTNEDGWYQTSVATEDDQ